ncbi:hypothetical protein RF11_01732 [Thelohanellus kitauei]|uniref:Uncharacterized protein n=1 Tax=Thelohanellus kitauei TaxID=669202 RepID=A0A0C2IJE0_THEKT|nr:hypothetical protein RF11_01732 [Thelohanellus kitauei]
MTEMAKRINPHILVPMIDIMRTNKNGTTPPVLKKSKRVIIIVSRYSGKEQLFWFEIPYFKLNPCPTLRIYVYLNSFFPDKIKYKDEEIPNIVVDKLFEHLFFFE